MSDFQTVTRKKTRKVPEEERDEDYLASAKYIKANDKLTAQCCRRYPDALVEATRNNYKYCYLFKYNDDTNRGEIRNETILGVSTKSLLSGEWIPTARKYFESEKCKPIGRRLEEFIKQKQFNNGIDEETGCAHTITTFWRKKEPSVFSNGIIVGRAGIQYK